ncbi:hypothetical protein QYM36_005095 [Artemia franciscana]|uniref:Uncharacterized protein n=1 Tax=Artemia franciscana TaxID=6661 RepID=A0AA88I1V6_ARTSF|nr:hypothetical protein QYM36_005095 [Artemia franciscana]
MSNKVLSKTENFEKERDVSCAMGDKKAVMKRIYIFQSTGSSKLGLVAKKVDLDNDSYDQVDENAAIVSKIKKMNGDKKIGIEENQIISLHRHHACFEGNLAEHVDNILEGEADVNLISKNGCTALEECAAAMGLFFSRPLKRYVIGESYSSAIYIATLDLIMHIIKMKAANLFVSEKNLLLQGIIAPLIGFPDEDLSEYENQCKREVEMMTKKKLHESNFSLYDVLTQETSCLAVHMRNETISRASKSENYGVEFPMFSYMLKSQLRKGMESSLEIE